jgi:hypothetical protein
VIRKLSLKVILPTSRRREYACPCFCVSNKATLSLKLFSRAPSSPAKHFYPMLKAVVPNHTCKPYAQIISPKPDEKKTVENHRLGIIRPESYAWNHTPGIIRPEPYAWNRTPGIIRPEPYAQNHTPGTIRPEPYARNHTLGTLCLEQYARDDASRIIYTHTPLSRMARFHKFRPGQQGIRDSWSSFGVGEFRTHKNSYGLGRYPDYRDPG